MSYQVIARKWRPQTFEEVTGQEAITQTLRNAIEFDRLHHAYLFSGARGVGKTTTARLLAKALNCHKSDKPTIHPCISTDEDVCPSCLEISESRSIDVLEFDAASHTGVDAIRDIILEGINVSAARDRYKVFIVDEVHMLSTSSFNALLKTLEEPPPNVVFIMATTELHKVPDTILSRCQEFDFRTIALSKIYDRLKIIAGAEKVDISDEALREIARSGEGSMRDAQSNFDQVISFSGEKIGVAEVTSALGLASAEMLTRIVKAISTRNRKEALTVVDELISRGQDLRNFCRDLLAFFRDLLVFKIAGESENLLDTAILSREEMLANSAEFSEADFLRFFNSLCETETQLKDATQPRYVLEMGLVKLIEMRRVIPVENLLERLAKLEGAWANGAPQSQPNIAGAATAEKKTLNIEEKTVEPPLPTISRGSVIDDEAPEEAPWEPEIQEVGTYYDEPPPAVAHVEKNAETRAEASVFSTRPETPAPDEETQAEASAPFTRPETPAPEEEIQAEASATSTKPEAAASDAEASVSPLPSDAPKTRSISDIYEFTASMPVKLAPITAEDLEHIEDGRLDAAYENKLLWSGDDLGPIRGASRLAESLVGGEISATIAGVAGETANGSAAGTAKAVIINIPNFDDEDESPAERQVLSDSPTQEELFAYANSHPVIKRALRVLRAKIIEVKKA
jgi:DNA polymerase III subunit gamma/tau